MHELLYRSEDKQARIRVSQSPVITQVQKKLQPTTLNQRGQKDFWMESFKNRKVRRVFVSRALFRRGGRGSRKSRPEA